MAVHIVVNLCFVSVHRDVMFAAHCRMRGIIAQLISCFWRKRISRRMNRLRALRSCAWMSTTKKQHSFNGHFPGQPGSAGTRIPPVWIIFIFILLVYRCLHGLYISSVLVKRQRLRSWSSGILAIPTSRLSTVGDRAFPVIASRVWNALPVDVISSTTLPAFKRLLKTELFSRSFPDDTAPAAHDYSVSVTFVVTS